MPEKTILAAVAFDNLLSDGHSFDSTINGDPDDIAAAIATHAEAGITHLQPHIAPFADEAIVHTEAGLEAWRRSG